MAKNYHHFFQGFISVMICLLVIQVGLMVFVDMAKAGPEIQKTDSSTIWQKEECKAEVKKIAEKYGYKFTLEQIENSFKNGKCFQPPISIKTSSGLTYDAGQGIAGYIVELYRYAVSIGGILAVVVMMVGGLLWMTAGGSSERVTQGKNYIFGALTGLILLLCAYLILNTVNTRLVNFGALEIPMIKGEKLAKFGCNWEKGSACPTAPTAKYPPTDPADCGPNTTGGTGACCCFVCLTDGRCNIDAECCQIGDPVQTGSTAGNWGGPDLVCNEGKGECLPPQPQGGDCEENGDCQAGLICLHELHNDRCEPPGTESNRSFCSTSIECESQCCCKTDYKVNQCMTKSDCENNKWGLSNLFKTSKGCM